jgi:N-acetylmuramoyl-L-alanine amidase
MPARNHNYLVPLAAISALAGTVLLWWWLQRQPAPVSAPAVVATADPQASWPSTLRRPVRWDELIRPMRGPTSEIQAALTQHYTPDAHWPRWIRFDTEGTHIRRTDGLEEVMVENSTEWHTPQRYWRRAAEMPRREGEKPLAGVRITIDPGHIGGAWAKLEERWYQIDAQHIAIMEGELTLRVAKRLKPQLEALGAIVTMVREKCEPVTQARPDDFLSPERSPSGAKKMFYRTAEIHARAEKINEKLRPDVVLCLHFNAEPWGNPQTPTFVERNHFHLLVNGHYMDDELSYDEVRASMAVRLIERVHDEEIALADTISYAMVAANKLPAYDYGGELQSPSTTHQPLPNNPFVWARNLLANRLYRCPVVYCEPYVMNHRGVYERIAAGDYEGNRLVDGTWQPSIFREYADGLTQGLVEYYQRHRPLAAPER